VAQHRVVFVQEHYLLGSKLTQAMQAYARMGVKAWLGEAQPTVKIGTLGGVGFLWGAGTHLQGHPRHIAPWQSSGGDFRNASYGTHNEGDRVR
jgi:hypothetical protein